MARAEPHFSMPLVAARQITSVNSQSAPAALERLIARQFEVPAHVEEREQETLHSARVRLGEETEEQESYKHPA
jgi:hypothetical protein